VRQDRLERRELADRYWYGAKERQRRQEQWQRGRRSNVPTMSCSGIVLFYSLLDEQQRRLYAGLESLGWGHGAINEWPGCWAWMWMPSPGPIRALNGQVLHERVRRVGGGRPRAEKNARNLSQLRQLLRDETAGEPHGTAGTLDRATPGADQRPTGALGLSVCPIPYGACWSRWTTPCTPTARVSPAAKPERDRQFRYLQNQRQAFTTKDCRLSVWTPRKRKWWTSSKMLAVFGARAAPGHDHDFRSQAKGMAIPRGLYDLLANRGSVLIGTSHDTAEFAVDAIVEWWRREGRRRYEQARSCWSWLTAEAVMEPGVAFGNAPSRKESPTALDSP